MFSPKAANSNQSSIKELGHPTLRDKDFKKLSASELYNVVSESLIQGYHFDDRLPEILLKLLQYASTNIETRKSAIELIIAVIKKHPGISLITAPHKNSLLHYALAMDPSELKLITLLIDTQPSLLKHKNKTFFG